MLTGLLHDSGLPTQRGQLLGTLPTVCRPNIPGILAAHGMAGRVPHFSPEEVVLKPGWLDKVEEVITGQKGLCDKLRRELADRNHVLMAIHCTESEARDLLDDLWGLGAECLCYRDEWRIHFDYVAQ